MCGGVDRWQLEIQLPGQALEEQKSFKAAADAKRKAFASPAFSEGGHHAQNRRT